MIGLTELIRVYCYKSTKFAIQLNQPFNLISLYSSIHRPSYVVPCPSSILRHPSSIFHRSSYAILSPLTFDFSPISFLFSLFPSSHLLILSTSIFKASPNPLIPQFLNPLIPNSLDSPNPQLFNFSYFRLIFRSFLPREAANPFCLCHSVWVCG